MEVILLKDIQSLGERGGVVRVKPGYARNYLLPQGFALEANPGNLKIFEQKKAKIDAKLAQERDAALVVAEAIGNTHVTIRKLVSEAETLYGSVTATEIGDELEKKGVDVDRRRIDLKGGIKAVGDHRVAIHLHADVVAEVLVTVEPEEE